jgi:hypothetical protein
MVFNMAILNVTLFVVPSGEFEGLLIFGESFDGGVWLTHIVIRVRGRLCGFS